MPSVTKPAAPTTIAQKYRFVVGAVLAETLTEVGYRVVEAPTPRRERGRGKTDDMDAVTAARSTLTMPLARLRDRRGGHDQVALQVLSVARTAQR